MARLNGIQRVLASNPSSSLIALENQLQNELELVLSQELELWALKSRINWMVMGDRNTSFYHISTLARRKRNTITMGKNEVGDWLSREREVMTHFREGFIKLYSTTQVKADWRHNLRHGWQVSLMKEEKNNLDQSVSYEEIASALWSLKAFKALGPDGLQAGFFSEILAHSRGFSKRRN